MSSLEDITYCECYNINLLSQNELCFQGLPFIVNIGLAVRVIIVTTPACFGKFVEICKHDGLDPFYKGHRSDGSRFIMITGINKTWRMF